MKVQFILIALMILQSGCRLKALSEISPTPDPWQELLLRTPYPYTSPLQSSISSPIDGTYVKVDLVQGTAVPCRRCPDYMPQSGIWKLSFDRGVFRIYQTVTGWKSIASYAISGDRLLIYNDPNCVDTTGEYIWKLFNGNLTLVEVEDTCAIHLRAVTLTQQPWKSCAVIASQSSQGNNHIYLQGCDK